MKERPIIFNSEMVRAILEKRKTQTRRIIKPRKPFLTQCKWYGPHPNGGWWGVDIPDGITPSQYGILAGDGMGFPCPYGVPGDRLWVRETWIPDPPQDGSWDYEVFTDGKVFNFDALPKSYKNPKHVIYKSSWGDIGFKWHPSIHMPRWASRITIEITDVRVQRVQEISEEDAIAEGIEYLFSKEDCLTVAGLIGSKQEDHGYKNYLWHGDFGSYGGGNKQSDSWPYQYSGYKSARDSYSSLWEKINAKRGYGWDINPWVWCLSFRVLEIQS